MVQATWMGNSRFAGQWSVKSVALKKQIILMESVLQVALLCVKLFLFYNGVIFIRVLYNFSIL